MNIPKIAESWPEQNGIYAGIARGFNDEPDGHVILLDEIPPTEKMNWNNATEWAASLGNGARLPSRFEMALIGANIADKISPGGYYWSASEHLSTGAWVQYLGSSYPGSQLNANKANVFYVRAVKRLVF